MTTVVAAPTYPVPGLTCRVTFTFTNGAANYLRVWCTVAPEDSELANALKKSQASRVLVYEGDGGAERPWLHTFDKGGPYTLLAQEYVKGNSWGGGYEGDTRGAPTEVKLGGETTLALHIAKRLNQTLGFGDDQATLVLFVHNNTIVTTVKSVHGIKTPIIVDWTSDRAASGAGAAQNAASNVAGMTPEAALAGNSVPGSFGAVIDSTIDSFASHTENTTGAYHNTADNQDDLQTNYKGATSPGGLARAINKLRRRLELHMLNAKENVPANPEYVAPGSVVIHDGGGAGPYFDLKNALLPIVADENKPETLYAAFADFWRAYEAHRTATMHDTADNTNTLWTPEAILAVHKDFMTQVAALSPAVHAGQSTGAARLIGQGGFVEA
jgi:hypothetical protein